MSTKVLLLSIIIAIPILCSAGSTELINSRSGFEQLCLFGKNKWITSILAFLGGILGLHRWYLGHYKAGFFHVLCLLFTLSALQFLVRGEGLFPILFIGLLLGYIGLEIIAQSKQTKLYFKPFQNILLGLAFAPLGISLLWIGLIVTFSGYSVYLVLFTSLFTLFFLFLSIRYAICSKREFIEKFYKNRSIWH